MRTKAALKNTITSILLEIALAVSGIVLPKFFIAFYGSSVNGLCTSIGQFITYMGLVEAGISAAGTVALYKPLADGDMRDVSGIVSAARSFYIKSGLIFLALDILLIIGYPFIVNNEITDMTFIREMIVILSISGLVDYFFLGKYRVLLVADQRSYVIYTAQIIGIVVTVVSSIILIKLEMSALIVKGVVALVYILRSIAIIIYAKKHYKGLNVKATPMKSKFSQRYAALFHQIVGMICNNTDIILLTILLPAGALAEVSVYSVYYLVMYTIYSLVNSISNGLSASFGQIMASDERDALYSNFSFYELAMFMLSFIAYSCMAVTMYSFVSLYSAEFTDGVVYTRWILVALFAATGLMQSIRLPGMTLICVAGHYKQTRGRAALEAALNLIISIALIFKLGIVGVIIGTLCSYSYRSIDTIIYSGTRFVKGTLSRSFIRLLRNAVVAAGVLVIGFLMMPQSASGWMSWVLWTALYAVITLVAFALVNYIFEPKEFKAVLTKLKSLRG